MKNIGLILGFIIVFSGFGFAQSGNDYKSKNRKLNKHDKHTKEVVTPIAVNQSSEEAEIYDYKNRNQKFHKDSHDDQLLIRKDVIVNDYRVLNRKFSKGQNGKLINKLSSDDMLTDKR